MSMPKKVKNKKKNNKTCVCATYCVHSRLYNISHVTEEYS